MNEIGFPSLDYCKTVAPFSRHAVASGVSGTAEHDGIGQVRVEVDGRSDLLKFYGFEIEGTSPLIFLRGDVVTGPEVMEGYERWTPAGLQEAAETIASTAGRTYIHLARPGMLGSTGSHWDRRRPREVALVDAALTKLVQRFGWNQIHLIGHSGGGHLVAALMSRRRDIGCAVMAAGNLAVKLRNQRLQGDPSVDVTGHRDFLDPIDEVRSVRVDSPRTIIVVSGRHDPNVLLGEQQAYIDALRPFRPDVEGEVIDQVENPHMIQVPAHRIAFKAANALGELRC